MQELNWTDVLNDGWSTEIQEKSTNIGSFLMRPVKLRDREEKGPPSCLPYFKKYISIRFIVLFYYLTYLFISATVYICHTRSVFDIEAIRVCAQSVAPVEGLAELISCYIITSLPRSRALQCITYSKRLHCTGLVFPIEWSYRLTVETASHSPQRPFKKLPFNIQSYLVSLIMEMFSPSDEMFVRYACSHLGVTKNV